jgi:hypothetical protein
MVVQSGAGRRVELERAGGRVSEAVCRPSTLVSKGSHDGNSLRRVQEHAHKQHAFQVPTEGSSSSKLPRKAQEL